MILATREVIITVAKQQVLVNRKSDFSLNTDPPHSTTVPTTLIPPNVQKFHQLNSHMFLRFFLVLKPPTLFHSYPSDQHFSVL